MSGRIWAALVCLGWAAALAQTITLSWVPDCGGVSYGFPLPYVRTNMASSLELEYFVFRLVVAWLTYAVVVALPASWVVRRALRQRRFARFAMLGSLLVPWLTVLQLAWLIALGVYRPQLSAPERLNVDHWHEVRVFLGFPRWNTHLEPACD